MAHETCITLYLYTIVPSVFQNTLFDIVHIKSKHLIILHYTEIINQIADIIFFNHYKNTTTATLLGYLTSAWKYTHSTT